VKWGSACVEQLRGDFSFAIWDTVKEQLFCARDQLGVKPFYYANVGSVVVFSNSLDCVRRHPTVSERLNDLAIADFLVFGMNREPATTSFVDIQRLPPAHILECRRSNVSARRYWVLPVSAPICHRRPRECVEQFRELLDRAIADRLRTDSVAVFMSGGLDSSTVAASAQRILGLPTGVSAYTEVFDSLIPNEERRYATLVAKTLKIPIEFHANEMTLSKDRDYEHHHLPEPVHSPGSDGGLGQLREAAARNSVALTGYGADPALACLLSVKEKKKKTERNKIEL